MVNKKKLLFDLLLSLFPNNDNLRAVIAGLDYPQIDWLLAALPGTNVPRMTFTLEAVNQLEAHGQAEKPLFDTLAAMFPARRALVESVDKASLRPEIEDRGETAGGSIGADAAPVTDALVEAQEKIMGTRPTFLDVAYLALGYQRARAVAKLRMRFANGWYSGTAFLIAPQKLLTAHHNLITPEGERASEVTAQFDYERILDGPEPEGLTVPCSIATVVGESEDDWAVIDLSQPQAGRPLAKLSDVPVKVDDRVAIIQHPGGMVKQVALHSNLVTFADAARVQYLTDTLPGSSGAPVFDAKWNVVALHHAGGDLEVPGTKQMTYRNQGIAIAQVRKRMAVRGVTI